MYVHEVFLISLYIAIELQYIILLNFIVKSKLKVCLSLLKMS